MNTGGVASVLALALALLVASKFVIVVVRGVLAEGKPCLPNCIEALLPVKGRWLRLTLVAPAVVGVAIEVFLLAYAVIHGILAFGVHLLLLLCRGTR